MGWSPHTNQDTRVRKGLSNISGREAQTPQERKIQATAKKNNQPITNPGRSYHLFDTMVDACCVRLWLTDLGLGLGSVLPVSYAAGLKTWCRMTGVFCLHKPIQPNQHNRPTNQSTDQPTSQSTDNNQPVNRSTNHPNRPTKKPTNRSTNRPTTQPTNESTDQPTNQPTYPPIKQSTSQPTDNNARANR